MSAACPVCKGTGSTAQDYWSDLDCAHCNTASERAKFNEWTYKEALLGGGSGLAWIIYQAGKAAALEQAAKLETRYKHLRDDPKNSEIYPQHGMVWVSTYHHPKGTIPELKHAGYGEELDRNIDAAIAIRSLKP